MPEYALSGIRVVEIVDEAAEYCGLLLAGLGADVVKVEPPGGSPTRRIGPFYEDTPDPERSLYFWQYNRGKRSVVLDLDTPPGRECLVNLLASADVLLETTPPGRLPGLGLAPERLRAEFPRLIVARMTPFGDTGPWASFTGSDLVHLALGGQVMNCGYSPRPDRTYDLPPIAPQMWHAYHIAGEQLAIGILAALIHRQRTGVAQHVSCAVHEAVAKCTELDIMNWVMRRAPMYRQTCTHSAEQTSTGTPLLHTKDGRWLTLWMIGSRDLHRLGDFLRSYGITTAGIDVDPVGAPLPARSIPGSTARTAEPMQRGQELAQRLFRAFTFDEAPWQQAQEAGLLLAPLRRPEENAVDGHWLSRGTFTDIEHPEFGRSFRYATSKWLSTETPWRAGRRAPLVGEDTARVLSETGRSPEARGGAPAAPGRPGAVMPRTVDRDPSDTPTGRPFALAGVRILDFTWFLASAGATRFLAALGAECIKVEWHENPDTRLGAMAPVGGRAARQRATAPLPGIDDPDMGGQFHNKNSGKRGISLNLRHPRGLEIAKRLVAISDVVAEGFSPGVMDRLGLGYDVLRSVRPDIIYAHQSGMGAAGTYGRYRAVGPVAQALSGISEMSGLPEPAPPAGWGFSYLDWIGAYSFATAILAALLHRDRTGRGQRIDASQTEVGIFLNGTAVLDWSANGRRWRRYGNRSPFRPAAPHGIYPCRGDDRWIAIACFTEAQWSALRAVAGDPGWSRETRFATLTARLAHQDELDAHLAAWTATREPYELMYELQEAGVPAGVCQTAEDRVDRDPQLAELRWLTEITGTRIGTWPIPEIPFRLSETPAYIGGSIDRGAPCYGEDNEYVYGHLLGMSTTEIRQLAEDNVI